MLLITNNCQHFDVTIPSENCEPVIIELLKKLQPEWSVDDLLFKYFTDGISNKLVGCMLKDGDEKDLVMFRLYGNKTELFIDRKKELENLEFLHSKGFAPRLYGTFQNGYCCGFIPGRTLETEEMSSVRYSELIAKKLAHVHAIKLSPEAKAQEPCAFTMTEKFLRVLPERFEDSGKQERFKKEISSKIDFVKEVNFLKSILAKANIPLAYCHNDLLVKNIILNSDEEDVSFIDYEYGAFNYTYFDIGNHFNEYGGIVEIPDYSLYPNKEYQLKWLRIYSEEKVKVEGSQEIISEQHLEKMYSMVNKFSLVSHLFWGIQGLLQAHFSSIDFDFLEYAKSRFDQYLRTKDEILNL